MPGADNKHWGYADEYDRQRLYSHGVSLSFKYMQTLKVCKYMF